MYKRQTPASSTVVPDKAALGAIPPALPVHKDSVVRQTNSGPQAPSAVSHSASRVAGTNRRQIPIVPTASPLLPNPLPSLLPSGLISSRTRRRRAAAAGKPQAAVNYGFDRSDPTPPTVPRPAPTARKPRARLGPPRLFRLRAVAPTTRFLLCRSNAPPTRPHLLLLCLVPSFQRHVGVSAPQSPSPRRHHQQKSSSSSLPSGTRTMRGRVSNAPNRFVTPPSGIVFSDVPRSSPTISLFIRHLANAPHCRKCAL